MKPWSQLRPDGQTLRVDAAAFLRVASVSAEPLAAIVTDLAEHPVWSKRHDALIWVDITAGRVLQTTTDGRTTQLFESSGAVGAALPAPDGRIILVADEGVLSVAADGSEPKVIAPPPAAELRFNDAGLDPLGRLWAGVLPREDPAPGAPLAGELWRLDADGQWETIFTEMGCPNGIAWSADGGTLLFCESDTRRIAAADYDLATGIATNWRVGWEFSGDGDWVPDGLEWLADGRLWVAFWGLGAAARFNAQGAVDLVVRTADRRTTSMATADDGTIWVTAASGLSAVTDVV